MIANCILEGRQVRLRPLQERDVSYLALWFGDPEVRNWTHLSEDPPSAQTVEGHRERYHRMRDDPRQVRFCIETTDGHPIGDLGLLDIHPHGRAELGITIGDKAYWIEAVAGHTTPGLTAQKGSVACVILPPDPPDSTLKFSGAPPMITVADGDATAFVQLLGKVCNDAFAAE